ncbi:lytic transglycosylase domain-containing protein [Nocardia amikacinitolerans]|uniref:lytic transglycosylase domain-containing protein n=1 Tax=Nocardia amikacinitolerans TaxID=756689 RepID=UPI0020A257FE|nr:lytic murein transglycosylase [Nocardia amikacinitolerans]MCP2278647.1 Membrane-bound lytic murein transglycosylase B [Nocardia amikacinitolerans]
MRVSAPLTASALAVAGLIVTGSATYSSGSSAPPEAPEAILAGAREGSVPKGDEDVLARTVGLLPVAPDAPRRLRAMTPAIASSVSLQDISLPNTGGSLGIPEIVLAAYRNAELALESSMPECGLTWNLLAGIGRIESAHAGNGRTDAAGTTVSPIFGPALDGSVPGNEIIKAADGGYVRAMGPMQFLPSTWSSYATDGNGDGVADPHNVFDASLAAGKYLCSGGSDLRDPAQELRAVLRYNNSLSYASDVLSWSAAYRTGGAPARVTIDPGLIPPGSAPVIRSGPEMVAVDTTAPPTIPLEPAPTTEVPVAPAPTQVMITIPGLPPIPCGIFCPQPQPNPCEQVVVPAPMPRPGEPGGRLLAPGRSYGGTAVEPIQPEAPPVRPGMPCTSEDPHPQTGGQPYDEPKPQDVPPESALPESDPGPDSSAAPESDLSDPGPAPAVAPGSNLPEPVPQLPAPAGPPPAITLPFGIVIPLPVPRG